MYFCALCDTIAFPSVRKGLMPRIRRFFETALGVVRAFPLSKAASAAAVSLVLFLAACVNLAGMAGVSVWIALAVSAGGAGAAAGVMFFASSDRAVYGFLRSLTTVALAAVAVALAFPAWQVVSGGADHSLAGRMAPLFAVALALYIAAIWLASASAPRREEFSGALFSEPAAHLSLIASLVLSSGFLLGLNWWSEGPSGGDAVSVRFLERGIIPPVTTLLFFWGFLLLLGKLRGIRALRRAAGALRPPALPSESGGDVDRFSAMLWQKLEESYLIPRYIVWAVPVLGFIGTVLGISLAADGIRRILSSDTGLAGMSGELGGAIAPLGIAFDTTLIALSLSVVLMLMLTLVQRGEEGALAALETRLRNDARKR